MSDPLPTLRILRDQVFGLYAVVPSAQVETVRLRLLDFAVVFGVHMEGAERLDQTGHGTFVFGPLPDDDRMRMVKAGIGFEIIPGYVLNAQSWHSPVDRLFAIGWGDGMTEDEDWERFDLLALGLTREHLPELARLAADPEWCFVPESWPVSVVPLLAVQALAKVGGEAAVGHLLDLLRVTGSEEWDWLRDEVRNGLVGLGEAVAAPLGVFLSDETNDRWSRIAGVETFMKIVRAHPEARGASVERLTAQLAAYPVQDTDLNGFIVTALCDMKAVEALPLIERAFAAGRVDEMINGDWEDVQIQLGLKARRERLPKPNKLSKIGRQMREAFGLPEPLEDENGNRLEPAGTPVPVAPRVAKVGRNDPCPCGSGKKFKKCCGA